MAQTAHLDKEPDARERINAANLSALDREICTAREASQGQGWIAVNVKGKGLVVLSACSHAGIVNVLHHARASFPGVPLHAASTKLP